MFDQSITWRAVSRALPVEGEVLVSKSTVGRMVSGLSACLVACVLAGCAKDAGPVRADIAGSATFDGQPIVAGEITFIPDGVKGNKGPATSAVIKDGTYTTVGRAKGVVGGPHILRISAFDGKADAAKELPYGQPLFPPYEMKTELPAAAGAKGPLKFDVAVPKEATNPAARAIQQEV